MSPPRISWCGEEYVSVRLADHVDMHTVADVLRLQQLVSESAVAAAVVAAVPGWSTLLLWLDPDRPEAGQERIESTLREATKSAAERVITFESRVLTLPTQYGGDAGPDLELVAKVNNLSVTETVECLQSPQFAGMVSFSPGMANCMWVDQARALTAPKYDSPRTYTPPGTVGLGGSSISLYSVASPGGFQMVGRLAVPIYQAKPTLPAFEDSPTLIRPGDRIVLQAVEAHEADSIAEQVYRGSYAYDIGPGACRVEGGALTWL